MKLVSNESTTFQYNIRNKHDTTRMENDYRLKCIAKFMKENFNTVTTMTESNYLIRREACSFFRNISINLNKHNYSRWVKVPY